MPDKAIEKPLLIEWLQFLQKLQEGLLLGSSLLPVDLVAVGGIERHLEKNELTSGVVGHFGSLQPAQCPMRSQAQVSVLIVALGAMAAFELVEAKICIYYH